MDRKDPKVVPVDFDNRQHEVILDCLLTFRGYAPSAHAFRESVLADLADCMNKYNENFRNLFQLWLHRIRRL